MGLERVMANLKIPGAIATTLAPKTGRPGFAKLEQLGLPPQLPGAAPAPQDHKQRETSLELKPRHCLNHLWVWFHPLHTMEKGR